jgi:tRNA dimethylallyltransferase
MKNNTKPKIIVILGQTATGKSDLAVMLAQKTNGEVVSADSRQVYRGLNIGSGKITEKEMCGIPHHLLDIVHPKKVFSVAEYQTIALEKIKEILARGKTPIICGGTGFYIDAVTKGIVLPQVAPNIALRKKLEGKTNKQLLELLQKLDPARAETVDVKNNVRLIRAIEIAKELGSVPVLKHSTPRYTFIKIGLFTEPKTLGMRIEKRLLARMKIGMLQEAKTLHKQGLSWKRMDSLGLEYRYLARHLQNKITKQEMLDSLKTEIGQYAKRQMTWFKRDPEIIWFDVKNKISIIKILKLLNSKL